MLFALHITTIAEEVPAVGVETNPASLSAGSPLTFAILVDHPVPEEVTVIAPPFDASFYIDRIVKSARVSQTQVRTVIEYRFIPARSGRFTLGSFTVICPNGVTETVPYTFDIHPQAEEHRPPAVRLVWEGVPRQTAAGESIILALRANGWHSPQPQPAFFMLTAPQGAILSLQPLQAEERAGGLAARYTLIPLNEGNIRFEERTLQFENTLFEIPVLQINITAGVTGKKSQDTQMPAGSVAAVLTSSESSAEAEALNILSKFPDFDSSVFDRSFIVKIYNTARDLWNNGFYAQALAELRRNERDHPAGELLVPIRRQAEENLGIVNTLNENRMRRKFILGLFCFVIFTVIIATFVFFKLKKKFILIKVPLLCAVGLAVLGFFPLYRFLDSYVVLKTNDKSSGVTVRTSVRRTADFEGKELFHFQEGQPVTVILNSGLWVYVRANDSKGSSGWIPAEKVVFY
ncbi:MAG: hypothetical protein LBQ89_09415 [Treponema sp.]|nr:hypothetical protein [Treponema sp.]